MAATFGIAFIVAIGATPLARRVAEATAFYDRPEGYKGHARPTPYLGGVAIILALLVAILAPIGPEAAHLGAILGSAGLVFVVGTIDDRFGLGVTFRLLVQVLAAVLLWSADAGWDLFGSETADLAITVLWVVGVTNAFNLMDNLDGAAGTVGAVAAAGAGLLAAGEGDPGLAVIAVALSGACLGFLPYNLARPSRIFLGDGGSMQIGVVMAAVVMSTPHPDYGLTTMLAAAPLVGLVIFDTTLVVVSRRRRGATVLSGARDHLTHRISHRIGDPRRVALVLALSQVALSATAAALYQLPQEAMLLAGTAVVGLGAVGLALFQTRLLTPALAQEGS